jgi:hypothetical protein
MAEKSEEVTDLIRETTTPLPGGLIFLQTRHEGTGSHLIGRASLLPTDVLFALSVARAETNIVDAQLRMDTWRSWQVSAVVSGIEACVTP